MRKYGLLVFLLILNSILTGEWVDLGDNGNGEDLFKTTSSGLETTIVKFQLDGYEQELVNEKNETYHKINYPGEGRLLHTGKPELPVFSRLIAVPDVGEVNLEILEVTSAVVSDILIYPAQELRSESKPYLNEFTRDDEFYNTGSVYPDLAVQISTPAVMRDHRIVNLSLNPFRYDPLKRELEVFSEFTVRITTTERGGENTKNTVKKRSRFFEPLYQAYILNYDAAISSRDDQYQDPSYLFIYKDYAAIQNYLQQLFEWKHQKGFIINTVAVPAYTNNSTIKNYIQNYYDSDNPPEFVCLVGDSQAGNDNYVIPTWTNSSWSGEGDQPYTLLEGGDLLSDVFIGRISISGLTDLQVYIGKIMNYEKDPYTSNSAWFEKMLLVGDPSSSGYSCISTKIAIKEMVTQYFPAFSFIEDYQSPFVNTIASSIDSGLSYFNYRGWLGMSGWDNGDISSLNNGDMLPFAVILTCGTGDFNGDTSRSEQFIRVSNKGAIAAVGMSTWHTETVFNNALDGGCFTGIFQDGIYHTGGSVAAGKLNLYMEYFNSYPDKVEDFSHWINLMGDPGVELWTNFPAAMTVLYPDQIPVGTNYLEIEVKKGHGSPLANAWVTILKGDDEIFATGFTDTFGKVILEVDAGSTGDMDLTVTAHDYYPVRETIEIIQADVFVNVDEVIIDDDNSGSSDGNDDGELNPGENVELKVSLHNYGTSTAYSVTGLLESDSDMIAVTDNSEDYGTISPGSSVFSSDDFDISIEASALGGFSVPLRLTIQDNSRQEYEDFVYAEISGPNLIYSEYSIDDGNNGLLDPGETSDVMITVENFGTLPAENINTILTTRSDKIVIQDSTGFYGTVPAGSQQTNTSDVFVIKASDQSYPGTQVECKLYLYNTSGFETEFFFMLDIGQVEMTDPLGPDSYGYYCYDDGDLDYLETVPTYDWIEIDPGLGGSGTALNLYDGGNNGDTAIISIPFAFRFYGRSYSQLTVCTNGWVAPGSTEDFEFMNWHLPGPLGPSPMIAPFWDDLRTGSGDVYYYYNSSEHYFIVEWSELENNYNNADESFQLIIYDEFYYPTPTNDNEFKIQYREFANVDANHKEGPYSSIGIEDHYGSRGLEYSFQNQYPSSCKTLSDNSALLFTTRTSYIPGPPHAVFSADHFDFNLAPDQTDSDILTISNEGDNNLVYNILPLYGRDSGGPDDYGYIWMDSNDPNGPDYDWIDISGIGTLVSFPNNDTGSDLMSLDFDFEFYGTVYNQFRINPNGWIGFGNDLTTWTNTEIPSTGAPRPALMPFWDDLHPWDGSNGGGSVYYHSNSERLVVWFDSVIHWEGTYSGTYDFETVIYPSGKILFQYSSLSGDINTNTIGIQNAAGNDGLQISYNEYYLENNLAIMIIPPTSWMELSSLAGNIPSGESDDIMITIDSEDMEFGDYHCDLIINTNDPESSMVTIPVDLTVGQQVLDPPANVQSLIIGNTLQVSWDEVEDATSYDIYSSSDPYAPFAAWTLEVTGVSGTSMNLPLSDNRKYFKIVAVN